MIQKIREPVNALTHLIAAIISIAGFVLLLYVTRGTPDRTIPIAIYGVSLVSLFAASTAYHMVSANSKTIVVLRKLDHCAIYLLIAGTYTPICSIAFEGFWKWGLLAIIWALALIGIVIKIITLRAPRWLSAGVYLLMGWICVAAVGEMLRVLPTGSLIFLAAGGVTYTLGAIIYITKSMNFLPGRFGFHEIWHIFVILGASAHFLSITVILAPASP